MPQFDDTKVTSQLSELHRKEEEDLVRALAPKYELQYVDLHGITIDTDALRIVSESDARAAELAIFLERNKTLSVALKNPASQKTTALLETLTLKGYTLTKYMVSEKSLEHAYLRYKDARNATAEKRGILDVNPDAIAEFSQKITSDNDVASHLQEVQASRNAEKVSHMIEIVFGGALALGASDIHLEPEKTEVRLRYRLDGVLSDIASIPSDVYKFINSRFKLLAGLKLNIHNEAQDGRFTFLVGSRELEIRASVIPGAYGESIVMRLLDPDASSFKLENLGLNDQLKKILLEELARPNGAIITTGPTGSGKTTALYAFMQQVHKPEIKIITIEDPVEYKLPGIVQTQVDDDYTFESGLRAILRQDPDVIMIGEIRDREVAETAVHAALTGHLVFSTLHTNSAAGAFPRLIDLGIDYRMIGSAFNIIIGQRLVRTLCPECKTSRHATTEEQTLIARIMEVPVADHTVYDAHGCDACGGSGYKGRIGIFEGIRVDKAVEDAVIADPREANITKAAKPQGIPTMQQDGLIKVLRGETSLDELSRVIDLHNTRMEETQPTETV